jgi:hypothetical protein
MQRDSKKHHFVPQSLLRYFSVDGAGDYIYVFDKRCGKAFCSSLENAGSENDFNRLQTEGGVRNLEPEFNEPDARLHERLRQIHGSRSLSLLTAQERRDWADLVAVQLLRTPITRTTLTQVAVDLHVLAESGLTDTEAFNLPTDNDSRRSTFEMLADRDDWRRALEDKDFVLFEPAGSARFWISDHPVVLQSMVPYGDVGLRSPGIAVYLPLGPDLVLGLLCKSAAASLNARPIEALAIQPRRAQAYIALRGGLRTGCPVPRSDEVVDGFNSLQAAGSARFLYSPNESFSTAQATLRDHPDLAHVKTYVQIGRLGQSLPPAQNMPDGQWLVLFGRSNHYMLQIRDWQEGREPIEAVTEDIGTLERALVDAPFSEIRLYQDRQPRRMMREVRIEILSAVGSIRFRLRSVDSAMDALETVIAKGPP